MWQRAGGGAETPQPCAAARGGQAGFSHRLREELAEAIRVRVRLRRPGGRAAGQASPLFPGARPASRLSGSLLPPPLPAAARPTLRQERGGIGNTRGAAPAPAPFALRPRLQRPVSLRSRCAPLRSAPAAAAAMSADPVVFVSAARTAVGEWPGRAAGAGGPARC